MITREEYEFLKGCREQGCKWIARDYCDELYLYDYKPLKMDNVWHTDGNATLSIYIRRADNIFFNSITWEDEEPTKIDDLIRDYESHQVIVGEKVKVVIPQYVANWIEEVKGLTRNFKLELLFNTVQMPDDVYDWLDERYGDTDILARAWLDGFVVEKEKLYLVELPNSQRLAKSGDDIKFCDEQEWFEKDFKTKLTKAEIEAVDPRLMQFAVEVE